MMRLPVNIDFPFFSYGIFQPNHIGYFRIKDFVKEYTSNCKINGELWIRDGLPILNDSIEETIVLGHLIEFKPDNVQEAYESINDIEPNRQYRWAVTTVFTEGENIEANVLSGVSPLKGSERHLSSKWDGKDDLFHKGLDGIEKIIEENNFYGIEKWRIFSCGL